MAPRLSAEAQMLLRLLDDGDWHPLSDILAQLATTIAPGKALRRYEAHKRCREAIKGPRATPELGMLAQLSSGARSVSSDTYHSLSRRYLDTQEEAGVRYVRRREQPHPPAFGPRHVEAVAFVEEDHLVTRAILVEELGKAVVELREFIIDLLAANSDPAPPV